MSSSVVNVAEDCSGSQRRLTLALIFVIRIVCLSKIQVQSKRVTYNDTAGIRYAKGILQVVVGAGDHTERIFNGAVYHSRQSRGNSGQQRPWASWGPELGR